MVVQLAEQSQAGGADDGQPINFNVGCGSKGLPKTKTRGLHHEFCGASNSQIKENVERTTSRKMLLTCLSDPSSAVARSKATCHTFQKDHTFQHRRSARTTGAKAWMGQRSVDMRGVSCTRAEANPAVMRQQTGVWEGSRTNTPRKPTKAYPGIFVSAVKGIASSAAFSSGAAVNLHCVDVPERRARQCSS